MDMFVEIPTSMGSTAIPIHSIKRVERVGGQTVVRLYSADNEAVISGLSVAAILKRVRKVAEAYAQAMRGR